MGKYQKLTSIAAGALLALGATAAQAAEYPEKPVTIVVPYGVGGGIDTIARAVADAADDDMDVPIVVANKKGSGGLNGAQAVKRAKPDGYTVMITSGGALVLSSMTRGGDVDPFNDFEVIGQVGLLRSALMVPASSPFKTVGDLVEGLKAAPGKLRWAHAGRGGSHHIAGMGFLAKNGLEAQDVPFKGGAAARTAILGKQVDFGIMGIQLADGYDDIRTIGVNTSERDSIHPDVPTFQEAGFKFADVSSPVVMMAPKGTPPEVVTYLQDALQKVTDNASFGESMAKRGLAPVFADGAGAAAALKTLHSDATPLVESLKTN